MDGKAYWKEKGMESIVPEGFGECPEGWDVKELLTELTDELGYASVLDFGCGYGRLCESFDPVKYLGVDINADALSKAKKKFANYRFEPLGEDPMFTDICLGYTVFLHMKDHEIHEALKKMRCKWVIVAEILGREWRRDGLPPVYNRDLADYVQLFRAHDLILHKHVQRPYKRYAETSWYNGKNTNISFLVFKKCMRNPLV